MCSYFSPPYWKGKQVIGKKGTNEGRKIYTRDAFWCIFSKVFNCPSNKLCDFQKTLNHKLTTKYAEWHNTIMIILYNWSHNLDILVIIYMYVLLSWFNFTDFWWGAGGQEPKKQKEGNTKYDIKLTSTLRNNRTDEAACLILHLFK